MAASSVLSPLALNDFQDRLTAGENVPEKVYQFKRLRSFLQWPEWAKASPTRLAREGFFYTGVGDKVECYSCHGTLENWKYGENPLERHRQFYPACPHVKGVDKENRPISPEVAESQLVNYLQGNRDAGRDTVNYVLSVVKHRTTSQAREQHRLPSSALVQGNNDTYPGRESTDLSSIENNYPFSNSAQQQNVTSRGNENLALMQDENARRASYPVGWSAICPISPDELAKAGFFCMNSGDLVQCAFCSGAVRNWETGDSPFFEHKKHFPLCQFVLDRLEQEQRPSNSVPQSNTFSNSTNVPDLLLDESPIVTERPKHPEYAVEQNRIASYHNWPINKKQTPRDLAQAGFYYVGFGDNVKCFFCSGGLRNWEAQDVPWREHARWFPKCGFVKQCKGVTFIQEVQRERTMGRASQGHSSDGHPVEAREIKARLDTPMAQTVANMGYSKAKLHQAIEQRLRTHGDDFPNLQAFVEAVLELDDGEEQTGARNMRETSQISSVVQSRPDSSPQVQIQPQGQGASREFQNTTDTQHWMELSQVDENAEKARSRQKETNAKRKAKGVKTLNSLAVGSLVLKKQMNVGRKGGKLENWLGPYSILHIDQNNTMKLKNEKTGEILKKRVAYNQVMPYMKSNFPKKQKLDHHVTSTDPTSSNDANGLSPLLVEPLPQHFEDGPELGTHSLPTSDKQLVVGDNTLEMKDLETLHGKDWLNDNVVYGYLRLIAQQESYKNPTYVFPCFLASFWEKDNFEDFLYKDVQFSQYKSLLLPACLEQHWILLVADVEKCSFSVLDSLGTPRAQKLEQNWLKFWKIRGKEVTGITKDWVSAGLKSSKQEGGSDCGVFVLMNAEAFLTGADLTSVKQTSCQHFRDHVKKQLLKIFRNSDLRQGSNF